MNNCQPAHQPPAASTRTSPSSTDRRAGSGLPIVHQQQHEEYWVTEDAEYRIGVERREPSSASMKAFSVAQHRRGRRRTASGAYRLLSAELATNSSTRMQ